MRSEQARLARLAEVGVFTVDGELFTWSDAVLAAHVAGEWEPLRARTRAGLAAQRRLTAGGGELSHDETTAAAKRFRYERELRSRPRSSQHGSRIGG